MEKPRSVKDRIREQRKRNRRVTLAIIMIAVVSVSGFITYFVLNHSPSSQAVSFKAAIVDQLSGTFPNPSFNDNVKTTLMAAGYAVDYYAPDQVTVDLFRNLPSEHYGLIVIRAHSTGAIPGEAITIFTNEPGSLSLAQDKYPYELLTNQIELVAVDKESKAYFGIAPSFVRDGMQGKFPHSIIIMMGCTGLKDSEMAQAFVDRGAASYVSWDKSVTADRTDATTLDFLQSLTQGKTVGQAVSAAMDKVGPDPIYNSRLAFYPDNQATLVLSLQDKSVTANLQVMYEALVTWSPKEASVLNISPGV